MPRSERVCSIQALSWLNAIAEKNSGNESKSEKACKGCDQGLKNSVRPICEVISSDGMDSETDINDLEQTDS